MKHRTLLVLVAIALALAGAVPARGTVAAAPAARQLARIRIAFTQNNNVYIMNADGSGRREIATGGSRTGTSYWYQWSPDGKYLLLMGPAQSGTGDDLLLLNQEGGLLRTLATNVDGFGPAPHWAVDSDQIAYASGDTATDASQLSRRVTMSRMDVNGQHEPLWTYTTAAQDCYGLLRSSSVLHSGGWTSYDPSYRVAEGELEPVFAWSAGRHEAMYDDCNGINFTDTQTGAIHRLPDWPDVAMARSGAVVATVPCGGSSLHTYCIALVDPRSGSVARMLAPGIGPTLSHNGSVVYFVRQSPGPVLTVKWGDAQTYNNVAMTTASSAIWKIDADGTHPERLAHADAYVFTALQLTRDGHSLVFSRIDNPLAIWRHRTSGNLITFDMTTKYVPQVSIQRLNLATGKLTTIIRDAGRPAVQP